MRKRNSSEMLICFYSFILLSVFGLTSSDPIKPQFEPCRTSLGEHRRCMPLSDCPPLREYAEGKDKDRVISVIKDFGCGVFKVVFVCCTDPNVLKQFEGLHGPNPHDHSHCENHHHHHHPPEFFPSDNMKKPEPGFGGFGMQERPDQKGSNGDNSNDFNEKPVYEEVEEDDNAKVERQPKENGESKKDKATTPLWRSSNFIVSQADSWVWPNARSSEKYPGPTTTPDWLVVQQTNTPSGSFGHSGGNYNVKPSQLGSSGIVEPSVFGGGQPGGVSGTYNNGGLFGESSNSFGSQGFGSSSLGNQGFGSSSNLGNQGFGSSSNLGNQGFGSSSNLGNQGFGSSSNLGNQGFGSSRPDSSFSSNQGFSSPSGLNNQGPQTFGNFDNQRPINQGLGIIDRPISQGFGNERPLGSGFGNGRPSSGLNTASNYDNENRRPSSGRPGSQGNKRPTNYQEEDSFGSGSGFNNQRPNNQGSNNQRPNNNKKPNRRGNKRRLLPDGECGIELSDKIIGGENTKLDEFPWMALLHFTSSDGQDRGYGCGGSLINERYVLTAAHCIKGPSLPDSINVKEVRLGEYDLTKERDCVNDVCSPTPIDVAVEEIIPHPDYKPNDKAQHHDIALIRLRKKVPFTTYVSPICLPGDELKNKDYTGKQMTVAGWGKTANGVNAKSSSIKQKVTLPFVTLQDCKPFYEGINIRLRNTQLCAGGQKAKDSCQGDSGGPLMTNEVVNGRSSWYATGIVSFGPEDCGIQNIAGVYTRVSEYVDWILDNMRE